MSYGDEYPLGSKRQPLKGGGGIKTKPIAKPIHLMNALIEKLILKGAVILRAVLKNFATTAVGIALVIMGVFDGAEPNAEIILAGVAAIMGRNAWTSSQESGVRKEVIKKPADL